MSRRRPKSEPCDYEYTEVLDDEVDSAGDGEYNPVPTERTDSKTTIPYKTLAFILVFFVMGSVSEFFLENRTKLQSSFQICICFGILTTSGYFGEQYQDRGLPSLIIGILMFIPGGYYVYIFIFILCKREGFSFEDIPML